MSQELEDRFRKFAERVRDFCRKIKWDIISREYIIQLVRASSSIGANYIEASDSLGIADRKMKIKIARREAKESIYWLKLLVVFIDESLKNEYDFLIDEAEQIRKILSSIIIKLE